MSIRTMNQLYEKLYSKGLYKELWYCPTVKDPNLGALNAEHDRRYITIQVTTHQS